jgi:hypothetical protein
MKIYFKIYVSDIRFLTRRICFLRNILQTWRFGVGSTRISFSLILVLQIDFILVPIYNFFLKRLKGRGMFIQGEHKIASFSSVWEWKCE